MNTINYPLKLKNLMLLLLFSIFATISFSQTKKITLDERGVNKVISINKSKGYPDFSGILSEYIFSVDQLKIASQNTSQFVSEIKNNPIVVDCELDVENLIVIITTETTNTKINDIEDPTAASLKALLSDYNIKMLSYKKIVYCKN